MKGELLYTQSDNRLSKIRRLLRSVLLVFVWLCVGTAVAQQGNNAVYVGGRVFGGGNLALVTGNTEVTVNQVGSVVEGDVYGGGALADVGTDNTNTTIVNIFEGTINGDIYGGGLGRKASEGVTEVAAAVNGVVTVKIGDGVVDPSTNLATSVSYNPIIGGNVFGCNNANGTPKDNVTVHIFKTAHTSTDIADYFGDDADYAIDTVFGGGNKAHYQPTTENSKTTVHVYTCDNTIQKVYGGGNAADVGTDGDDGIKSATNVIIDGGRIEWVFGGGNGSGNNDDPTSPYYNPGANIFNDVSVTFRAGDIKYFFGGSNQKGEIPGNRTISILNDVTNCFSGDRINHIGQLYGGNNLAASTRPGNITLDMPCYGDLPYKVDYLYGGSRNADFNGNITLNVGGGEYDYIFGGNNLGGTITGDVTLNLFGGTINEAAFGGNNAGGDVEGKITVNLLEQSCPLTVHNIYGGGQLAAYTPTTLGAYPEVNLIHGTVSKKADGTGGNVFGGGLGSTAVVASSPVVNVGYDNVSMASLIPTLLPEGVTLQTANVVVQGDVYGGGEEAAVNGSVTVNVQQVSVEGLTASTTVVGDVYGGGALADVNVTTNGSGEPIYNEGTTTSVTLSGGTVGNIYGGGLGRQADQGQGVTAVEAKVYGPVQVTVTGGTVTNSVYGCNNLNGAPQSTVNVDIYNTDPAASGTTYALSHVFGGGNQADYEGTPVVNIHNCNNSIGYVYGGGNAADVEGTDVTVYGGNTIGEVYGGCYGADVTDYGTDVKIRGGKIGKVFGGNNASGSVTGAISVDVNKDGDSDPNGTATACNMIIGEVYGGGNFAASEAGTITIGCTGTLTDAHSTNPGNIGSTLEGIGVVYGGANQANITAGTIQLDIESGMVGTVFGGNNISGTIAGDIVVNINKKDESENTVCPDDWYVGDVYGGGNEAWYGGIPDVNIMAGLVSGTVYGGGNNITDGTKGVGGSDVVMTGGIVLGGVYGGCNLKGTVTGNSVVTILGGEIGSQALLNDSIVTNVFGGGLGFNTKVDGDVTVTISRATGDDAPEAPIIYGDVYGGSALGNVNSGAGNTTTVDILDGILKTRIDQETLSNGQIIYFYTGGNVYGGGLGDANHAAEVKGVVVVNIGSGTVDQQTGFSTSTSGNATIGGNVYGCNNTNGAPEQNVTVNVYQTAHTDGTGGTPNNTVDGDAFAIPNVFGGGNQANLLPGMTTTVNIYSCENTIGRVFGGGNAAATNSVTTFIQGGRFEQVFGGGNGERGSSYAANVNGTVDLLIHGGYVGQFFGGSNQNGSISGNINVVADNSGPCPGNLVVDEFFCGGNYVDVEGDLETTIDCSDGMEVRNLYGGCNMAHISGHVVLNVYGGIYTNVYGGSKGDLASLGSGHVDKAADIDGYVILNLYGGTIENVFGGSNVNGNIDGRIIVNVLDVEGECPLYITNIYGGSNMTSYNPTDVSMESPLVNVVHAKYGISGNVYGGSKGLVGYPATVQANPRVNLGYVSDMIDNGNNVYLGNYVTSYPLLLNLPRAIVAGSVFGGCDAAEVIGNTAVYLRNRSKVFGNVYGGGNMGKVTGNTKVIVNGANQ